MASGFTPIRDAATVDLGQRFPISPRVALAEFVGTAVLVAAVVGSGIMATSLTSDLAVALLINAVATVAALGVLIWACGPISGAHFNPAVTLVAVLQRQMRVGIGALYVVLQVTGACIGVAVAQAMFAQPWWEPATQLRSGWDLWLGEVVATAGLLVVIGLLVQRGQTGLAAVLVPAWIGSAYFVTSSTSFANPAVTIGRSLSDSFAGIAPNSVPAFILAQILGALLGGLLVWSLSTRAERSRKDPQTASR